MDIKNNKKRLLNAINMKSHGFVINLYVYHIEIIVRI